MHKEIFKCIKRLLATQIPHGKHEQNGQYSASNELEKWTIIQQNLNKS